MTAASNNGNNRAASHLLTVRFMLHSAQNMPDETRMIAVPASHRAAAQQHSTRTMK